MSKNTKINKTATAKNLQTCIVSLDADTLTALIGQSITLTAKVDPPAIYDVNFKLNGVTINPLPILTDSIGIAILPWNTSGRLPGLYDLTIEVVGPVPISCISSPLTVALTTTTCTGITIDTPSPIIAYMGDVISISITSNVTEQSIVELLASSTFFPGEMRAGSYITPPTGGSFTITADSTGAPLGTYNIVVKIGNGPAQQCISNSVEIILQSISTCTSITTPTATPSTVTIGDTIILTATTQPTTSIFTVSFKDQYNNVLGTANTISGVATLQWNTAGKIAGTYNIRANVSTQCSSPTAVPVTLNTPGTCTMTMTESDTYTAVIGSTITLTTRIDPPGTYDINLKIDGVTINTVSITTDPSGMVMLPFATTGQPPGLHNLRVEIIGPSPMSCESGVDVALTTTTCTGITIDTPSPVSAYIGDIVSMSATAMVTEQSVIEFRETTTGQRGFGCITPPTGGSCTITGDIPIGTPPGTYNFVASIGNGPFLQCVSDPIELIVLQSMNICGWINSKGGRNNLRIFDIMTLVGAYLGQSNLGFTIAIAHIMGSVAYYLNNLPSGDTLTGCLPT